MDHSACMPLENEHKEIYETFQTKVAWHVGLAMCYGLLLAIYNLPLATCHYGVKVPKGGFHSKVTHVKG